MEQEVKTLKKDLITNIVDVIGTENPNLELIINDKLNIDVVGSLPKRMQFSMGANPETLCFEDEDLMLDVLISHPEYKNAEDLRQKVIQILKQKNKNIMFLSHEEETSTRTQYLFHRQYPVMICKDFNFQTKYCLKLIFVTPFTAKQVIG
jgi:hypothetical protein